MVDLFIERLIGSFLVLNLFSFFVVVVVVVIVVVVVVNLKYRCRSTQRINEHTINFTR